MAGPFVSSFLFLFFFLFLYFHQQPTTAKTSSFVLSFPPSSIKKKKRTLVSHLHMVFTSPFRSRSYERLKEDESNATVASSSSSIKSPEPSSSVSRVEEKTPTTNKIAFPEHEDDSMRTPSPEEQPSSSSKRNNNNNTNASGRKVLG